MNVRPARPEEQAEIEAIASHYDTGLSWQVELRTGKDETAMTFRTVPLPRSVRHTPPARPAPVPLEPGDREYYIVAEETGGEILGYLRAEVEDWRRAGWITHLTVVPRHRRNQVGATLVNHAKRWGRINDLHSLLAEVQMSNVPATRFLERCGFRLAGYNDSLYASREVALYFACRLE